MPVDSFFNFFKPPQPPSMEAMEEGNVDEDELEDLDEKLEIDYQLGEDLKERVSLLCGHIINRGTVLLI